MAPTNDASSLALSRPPASPEHDAFDDLPGAIVAGRHGDLRSLRRAHRPFALAAIARERGIRHDRLQAHLAGAALELRALDARLAADQLGARRQCDLVDDAAHGLALERAPGDVRGQVAGILNREPHLPRVGAERDNFRAQRLEPREGERLPHDPAREAPHLALAVLDRRIAEDAQPVPSTELHRAELRMLERIPAHVAFAAELAIAPAQELEIVLGRMLAVPVDEVIALDSRFLHRRPDLHRPEELPEVLVGP